MRQPISQSLSMATASECLPRNALLALGVAVLYGTSSCALALVNKMVLSSYHFDGYFTLLSSQLAASMVFCFLTRDFFGNPFDVPLLSPSLLLSAVPMAVLGVLNVTAGLVGLQLVNVPMFFCLRRLVSMFILAYEFFVLGKAADVGSYAPVLLIAVSTLIAGWDSLSSEISGYLITMLNNVLTAANSVAVSQFKQKEKCSTFGIVLANSVVAFPLCLLGATITGEFKTVAAFPHLHDPGFLAGFALSTCMGLLLTFSSVLSVTFNSPLATSITGNVKDIFVTAAGWVLFGGMSVSPRSILGLIGTFVGAFAYSWSSLLTQQRIHTQSQPQLPMPVGGQNESELSAGNTELVASARNRVTEGAASAVDMPVVPAVGKLGGDSGGSIGADFPAPIQPLPEWDSSEAAPLTALESSGSASALVHGRARALA